jgi:hypothetical protein
MCVDRLPLADDAIELQQIGNYGIHLVIGQRLRFIKWHRSPHIIEKRRRVGSETSDRFDRRLIARKRPNPANQ